MAGEAVGGQKVLPILTERELEEWLGRIKDAIRDTKYGEIKLVMQEGLPYELIVTTKHRRKN